MLCGPERRRSITVTRASNGANSLLRNVSAAFGSRHWSMFSRTLASRSLTRATSGATSLVHAATVASTGTLTYLPSFFGGVRS